MQSIEPTFLPKEAVKHRELRSSGTVVSAELDGETVLLDVETGVYFGLDPVGTRIWQMISLGIDEEELYCSLAQEFAVEPEMLRADLETFLADLEEQKLLERWEP